jgi:ferric-dicitrate binding protein FerR (iron transport regulator)
MTDNRLVQLIVRQLSNELSAEEAVELENWAAGDPNNRLLLGKMSNADEVERELNVWRNIEPDRGYVRWLSEMRFRNRRRVVRIVGWSVAASLLAAVAVVTLNKQSYKELITTPTVASHHQTVLPGRNTATLTLGNGSQIILDSAAKGELAVQGKTRLMKSDSGSLSYMAAADGKEEAMTYNVLTTPRSGQYQLTLPDGSKVWLNNVSSLRYPTAFLGKDRTVELTGEAYFEVRHDVTKPFRVRINGESVEVLGTSFNIMAYPEETAQTTLLTGAVRVASGRQTVELTPDEQAQLQNTGSLKVVRNVPSQDIVSWKNGFFYFGRASFEAVMRQLARWYDVDVVYEGKVPDLEFGGKIDRSLPLNELLKFLDKNQVHFRLEGRRIIVL